MRDGDWLLAGRPELPALERFLRSRGPLAAGFVGRILRGGLLRMPNHVRGGIAVLPRGGGIVAALLLAPGGTVFPQLPAEELGEGELAGLAALVGGRAYLPASAVGPADCVEAFERALGLRPVCEVRYLLMGRGPGGRAATAAPRPPAGLALALAGAADLEALVPLQAAYEREEVVTSIHEFDPAGSRAALARSLREQLIVMASLDGRAVGKAGTNARAFDLDQIGGVYVEPGLRGRGLGRALMDALLARTGASGRGAALFVKEGNAAARGLYEGLGFDPLGPFRADYYLR